MNRPPVVGVDPGATETGLVARQGDDLLWRGVVARTPAMSIEDYIRAVLEDLAQPVTLLPVPAVVAVEGLVAPHGRTPRGKGSLSLQGLIDTGVVLGAVITAAVTSPGWRLVVVPPGEHGQAPLVAYPRMLRPIRGKGAGFDVLRHARSAWDIAGAGAHLARLAHLEEVTP